MKKMTCRQLGGACDLEFRASTFEEMSELSKQHGMEMFRKNDPAHMKAMDEMRQLMQSPEPMTKWMAAKEEEFESLPDL